MEQEPEENVYKCKIYDRPPTHVGDVIGDSSRTIFAWMTGILDKIKCGYYDHPWDMDDFGRCYKLLLEYPEWKERIHEMVALGGNWAKIAPLWSELEAEYLLDVEDEGKYDVFREGRFRKLINEKVFDK